MLNVVVDTNQFLSGFLYHGMSSFIFDLVIANRIKLYVSPTLTKGVLNKLQDFNVPQQVEIEIMTFIKTKGIIIKPMIKVTVCRDAEDNFLLELTETAKADYLITRDKDLLSLSGSAWKRAKIVKPEDFLPLLRAKGIID